MSLDPDIAMLVTEIDANLSHAETIVHGLTREQFQWRPEPGRWSIGECIAHLNAAKRSRFPMGGTDKPPCVTGCGQTGNPH